MNKLITFNPESLPFCTKNDAINSIISFLRLIAGLKRYGIEKLVIDDDPKQYWFNLALFNQYYIRDWYHDNKDNPQLKDYCRRIKSLETQNPLFIHIEDCEYSCELQLLQTDLLSCSGNIKIFIAAYQRNKMLLSFSSEKWQLDLIDIKAKVLDENGSLMAFNDQLVHFHDESSLKTHQKWLEDIQKNTIDTPRLLYEQRETLYPNLKFVGDAPTQLKTWSGQKNIFNKIIGILNILNEFSLQWLEDKNPIYLDNLLISHGLSTEVSNESQSVAQNPKLRSKREFYLDDGEKIYFEKHIKLDGVRLHFYPNTNNRTIYIGYIGSHLPTKKY